MNTWDTTAANVVELPSGRLVRGRSLRRDPVAGRPASSDSAGPADIELILLGSHRQFTAWSAGPLSADESRWVKWPDFRSPADHSAAATALLELWARAESSRVSVTCSGGRGRTGTALACIAIIDGVPGEEAVSFIRHQYDPKAVETPWQRRFVTRFPGLLASLDQDR